MQMTVSEVEIYQCATVLLRSGRELALDLCVCNIRRFHETGDMLGVSVWMRILNTIEILSSHTDPSTLH